MVHPPHPPVRRVHPRRDNRRRHRDDCALLLHRSPSPSRHRRPESLHHGDFRVTSRRTAQGIRGTEEGQYFFQRGQEDGEDRGDGEERGL